MTDYKGLRDNHLNIFYQYNAKSYLENNITKAFINSIDSLPIEKKKKLLSSLFGIKLNSDNIRLEFYLQKKPPVEKITAFSEDKRIMFGFSPTGECWGFSGQDIKDEKSLSQAIKNYLKENIQNEEELNRETKKAVAEYLNFQRGDSIPDGWIFVYTDGIPDYVIALENKRYNLDPTQINNHIVKSLCILPNKNQIIYKKYSYIKEIFEKLDTFITDQFIEYLTILSYYGVDNFSIACSADTSTNKDIRKRLVLPFGEKILTHLGYEQIDNRKWNVIRAHVNYAYLREINLEFKDDLIEVQLAFGSTQRSSYEMISSIDNINIQDDHITRCHPTFHLQNVWRKNIGKSYLDFNNDLNKYISFFKTNLAFIKQKKLYEAIELYGQMFNAGLIYESDLNRIKEQFSNEQRVVSIVPELSINYGWTYEEASTMGLEKFTDELKNKIDKVLLSMKLVP